MSEDLTLRDQRDYAWHYFQLHAQQRMSIFNFFIVISTLLSAGLARCLGNEHRNPFIGIIIGLCMIAISFIFWKLDDRIGYLIKHSEAALKKIECISIKEESFCDNSLALFLTEENKTEKLKMSKSRDPRKWHFSYSQCFKFVYILFAIVGILGIFFVFFQTIYLIILYIFELPMI